MRSMGLLLVLLLSSSAEAQREQIWLARYCVNEAGWQIGTPWEETTHRHDCAAMARSMRNNFQSRELRTWMMRRYGDNVFNVDRTQRRYIPFLRLSSRRPRYWNNANWRGLHYFRFVQIYNLSGDILDGSVRPPESCNPHHWGAPSLNRRSRRHGWVRQDCGPSANVYWRVPRRSVAYGAPLEDRND